MAERTGLDALQERVTQARMDVGALERVTSRLASARQDEARLAARIAELEKRLASERKDVERLAGKGPLALFYSVLGSLDDRRDKERQELVVAELALDEVAGERAALAGELAALTERARALADAPARLAEARAAKLAWLSAHDAQSARALAALGDSEAELKTEEQQILEASEAAERAQSAIADVLADLERASGWGTIDLLGGGMISSMVKHNHMDAARQRLPVLQNALQRLQRECADIGVKVEMQAATVHQGGRFVDTFFDNLISDWVSRVDISTAQDSVHDCRRGVEEAVEAIERKERALAVRRTELVAERLRIADA